MARWAVTPIQYTMRATRVRRTDNKLKIGHRPPLKRCLLSEISEDLCVCGLHVAARGEEEDFYLVLLVSA